MFFIVISYYSSHFCDLFVDIEKERTKYLHPKVDSMLWWLVEGKCMGTWSILIEGKGISRKKEFIFFNLNLYKIMLVDKFAML